MSPLIKGSMIAGGEIMYKLFGTLVPTADLDEYSFMNISELMFSSFEVVRYNA